MRKIETIVREEMDAAGSIELRMPIVLPADPWRATGRYDLYGDTLFKLTDRHDRDLILGPTQEEVVALDGGRRPARPTATCRRTSTRSNGSTATSSGPGSGCSACASS